MNWGQGLEGAAGGAMTGSVAGPWGALAGGALGGLAGLFGGGDPNQQYRDQLKAYAQMAGQRGAPQATDSSFRGNQADLVAMLEAQARGQGPSLAGQQLQAGQDRGMKQGAGLAASTRGPNAALAQMQALNVAGANQVQTNQDAAMARIQEQYNAQNQLGLTLQGARGQDQNMAQMNLEAKLRAMGINDNAVLQALMGGSQVQSRPGMGDQILAMGGGVAGMFGSQRGANSTPTMQPIAGGNPGAGGYFTPQR